MRNEEILHTVKEEGYTLHTVKGTTSHFIGHILRRNCLLRHVTEGNVEGRIVVAGRRIRRRQSCYITSFKFKLYFRRKIGSTSCPAEVIGSL